MATLETERPLMLNGQHRIEALHRAQEKVARTDVPPESPTSVTRELLIRAKERLSKRGGWESGAEISWWHEHGYRHNATVDELEDEELVNIAPRASFCAIGAIRTEARLMGVSCRDAEGLLAKAILNSNAPGDHLPWHGPSRTIATYNDDRRSKRPVIDKFERAIKLA